MNDNFDLRKFLVESKAIENMNPIFRKLNENTENTTTETTETTTETLTENALRAKIREMVLNELGGMSNTDEMGDEERDGEDAHEYFFDIDAEEEDDLYEGGGNNFTWVWDKSKLTRTSYNNGKYNTSEKFKSLEDLLANKEKADEIQKRREEKGRDKIEHILKEEDEDELYEAKKDKEEDLPADDAELDLDMAMDAEMDAPEAELTAAASGATGDAKELINHLMTSLDTAKAMGNEKLTTQILNTLKFAIDQSMAQ